MLLNNIYLRLILLFFFFNLKFSQKVTHNIFFFCETSGLFCIFNINLHICVLIGGGGVNFICDTWQFCTHKSLDSQHLAKHGSICTENCLKKSDSNQSAFPKKKIDVLLLFAFKNSVHILALLFDTNWLIAENNGLHVLIKSKKIVTLYNPGVPNRSIQKRLYFFNAQT